MVIDGLAITETVKNLIFFIIFFPKPINYSSNQLLIPILIPLYYFNFKKRKKVFLGDAGSFLLGGVNVVNGFTIIEDTNFIK